MYSLSMVIVEVRLLSGSCPGPDCFRFQLMTGERPFSKYSDSNVTIMVPKGKRPSKPLHFDVPGMSPAVWKIAERCWHEKPKERPEVNVVLGHLENLANPGVCTHEPEECSYHN